MEKIITGEKIAEVVGSRYDAILIAARRARELHNGWEPLVETDGSGAIMIALAEIEAGKIGREYLQKPQDISDEELRERRRQERNMRSRM